MLTLELVEESAGWLRVQIGDAPVFTVWHNGMREQQDFDLSARDVANLEYHPYDGSALVLRATHCGSRSRYEKRRANGDTCAVNLCAWIRSESVVL